MIFGPIENCLNFSMEEKSLLKFDLQEKLENPRFDGVLASQNIHKIIQNIKITQVWKTLDIFNIHLRIEMIKNLLLAISKNTSIERLLLSNFEFDNRFYGDEFVQLFTENKTLKIVQLHSFKLGEIVFKNFVLGMIQNQSIIRLELHGNDFSVNLHKKIYEMMSLNENLEEIVFSYQEFSEPTINNLMKGICKNKSKKLRVLHINQTDIGDTGCSYIANALEETDIFELVLKNCSIGNIGLKNLCNVLKSKNIKLKRLNFTYNPVSDSKQICNAISRNISLKKLILSLERISDLNSILEGLIQNKTLEKIIFIEGNKVNDLYKDIINEVFSSNITLKTLKFQNVKISEKSFTNLIFGLNMNTSIEKLKIDFVVLEKGNPKLGKIFHDYLKNTKTLKTLHLKVNSQRQSYLDDIFTSFHDNTSLKSLEFTYNTPVMYENDLIYEIIKSHPSLEYLYLSNKHLNYNKIEEAIIDNFRIYLMLNNLNSFAIHSVNMRNHVIKKIQRQFQFQTNNLKDIHFLFE